MSVFSADSRCVHRWIWLAVVLLSILAAFALDKAVDGCLYLPAGDAASRSASLVSKYGDWPETLLAGLLMVAMLWFCRRFSLGRLLLLILLAGLLTGFCATLIRSTTGRTRPLSSVPQGFYGPRYQGKWIFGKSEFGSFPSGHTAVWAGLAGAAWFRRRRWAVVFLVVALVVGWSRIALGCHHFSDVTASLVFGLVVGSWMCNHMETFVSDRWSKVAATA